MENSKFFSFWFLIFDDLVKSRESRHSCESRSTELIELTGFPLPAFAGTTFAGMTKMGPKKIFTNSSYLNFGLFSSAFSATSAVKVF